MTKNPVGIVAERMSWMAALRREMGWPEGVGGNDTIAYVSARPLDEALRLQLTRLALESRRDLVCGALSGGDGSAPLSVTVVLRDLTEVHVRGDHQPHAVDEHAPVVLVSTKRHEQVVMGARGILECRPGRPVGLKEGVARARGRIARRAVVTASPTMRVQMPGESRTEPTCAVRDAAAAAAD